jgi:hypothetical protein
LINREARQAFSTPTAVLLLALLISANLLGQSAGTLSGTVVGPSATPVANAKVSIKSAASAQPTEIQTDAAGRYSASNLPPGDYQVVVSAEGLAPKTVAVTIAPGSSQTLDLALTAAAAGQNAVSLEDLGLTPNQTQGSAQDQALLDRRSHMLKTHQRLGLITLAPLVATLAVSNGAAGRHSTASGRDLHMALGVTTVGLYFTSASFAIFAPKIPGTTVRGPIKLHRALAWVHGTGMVLTPILGALAYQQLNNGERVHGLAKAHGTVAIVTSAAYGLSIAAVSIRF